MTITIKQGKYFIGCCECESLKAAEKLLEAVKREYLIQGDQHA